MQAALTRLPDTFRWPGGRRLAVVFNIAYEAWSDGQAPGIGPMGNVLKPGYFDSNAHSWASFGLVRGIQRLLAIAERHRVKTSVMVNGVICERDRAMVRQLAQRGHEIVNHSWGMDVLPVYLDEAAERANLERNHHILRETAGVAPCGWISPRGTGSALSARLLAEAGYLHHGDVNDDGAEEGPLMLDVTAHTHVLGRPSGAWVYDTIMGRVTQCADVWICTREQMARHVLEHAPRA
jgi:peptidoglycan/xylan/chitin deacetylase (PgdA/CDA1 family)